MAPVCAPLISALTPSCAVDGAPWLQWTVALLLIILAILSVGPLTCRRTFRRERRDCNGNSAVDLARLSPRPMAVALDSTHSPDSCNVEAASSLLKRDGSESLNAIMLELCDDVVRHCIWPRILVDASNFREKTRQIARVRSVCRSWRRWTESTSEYTDHVESWIEDLLIQDSMQQGRVFDSEYESDWHYAENLYTYSCQQHLPRHDTIVTNYALFAQDSNVRPFMIVLMMVLSCVHVGGHIEHPTAIVGATIHPCMCLNLNPPTQFQQLPYCLVCLWF